jgi:preprotein translocase subunit SecA
MTAHAPGFFARLAMIAAMAPRFRKERIQTVIIGKKVPRNSKCVCGSGKKFKNCCARPGEYLTLQ